MKSFSLPQDKAVVLERFSRDVGVGYKNLTRKDFEELNELAQQWGLDCNSLSCSYYLSLLHQAIDFAYRQRFGSNSFNVRDNYMFENIMSTVSKTPGNKTIVLAHNGHLQKNEIYIASFFRLSVESILR